MLENKTCIPKFNNYYHIFRQDTHNYGKEDILAEMEEWEHILTSDLQFKLNYYIRRVILSNRMTSTIACTGRESFDKTFGYIKMSTQFLQYHDNPDKLHSVLCHESIHSLIGCFDHGTQFKQVGSIIMNIYKNLQISRTLGDVGYNTHRQEQREERQKWHVICQGCGQVIKRQKACDITKNPQRYKCGKCGGRFKTFKMESDGLMTEYITLSI